MPALILGGLVKALAKIATKVKAPLGGGVAGGAIAGGKVGGFTAIPNPAMIPFQMYMNITSAMAFGTFFIIGERIAYNELWPKIKADIDKGMDSADAVAKHTSPVLSGTMTQFGGLLDTVSDILGINAEGSSDIEEGETLITVTEADVMSWSDAYLTVQYNNLGKYTSFTRQFIRAQYLLRFNKKETDKIDSEQEQKDKLEDQQETNDEINKIIEDAPKVKRKATQSAKLERLRLIRLIDESYKKTLQTSKGKNWIRNATIAMQGFQVALARLLVRYDFS